MVEVSKSFLLTCRLLSTHTLHHSTLNLVVDFCRHQQWKS